MSSAVAHLIALYLPQFHPIPENDEWWGRGFTEWTNVAKAKPLFPGHRQPHLPADLGFYDLRLQEVREAQAEMARNAGVGAFCYWHYWFGNGRRIIERPFEEVRDSGKPDFPFCLAWANQSWTGIWYGNPKQTLVKQEYFGRADEEAHFRWARKAFEDSVQSDASSVEAHYDLGLVRQALGAYSEALASYDAALRLKPDFGEAQAARAEVLYTLGRYGEAWDAVLKARAAHADVDPGLAARIRMRLGK